MILFCFHENLIKSVQNVVHLHTHTRMLSVAVFICWWPRQWRSAADCQTFTKCCFRSL